MDIADILYKLVPEKLFISVRKFYYSFNRIIYPKLTEEKFTQILTSESGLKKGSIVFIHSALDKMNLGFPFYRVLNIILDVVGKEGTVLFPCWHFNYRAEDYLRNPDNIFDVRKSPTVMGILPELARRHKDAHRSLHPTNSVVAIGKLAEELVKEHHLSIYPSGEKSPFYKIIQHGGIVIGLGEKTVSLSFVHCVEDILKDKFPVETLMKEVFEAKVRDYGGNLINIKTLAPHVNITHRDTPGFVKKYISHESCREFTIHGTNYFTVDAKEMFEEMTRMALNNITIYSKKVLRKN